jgi:peroxiredoxin
VTQIPEVSVNTLKRIYIILYITLVVVLVSKGVSGLLSGSFVIGWAGVALTGLPLLVFLVNAMVFRRTVRSRPNLPLTVGIALVGLGLTAWQTFIGAGPDHLIALAVLGVIGLLIYIRWYSRFGRTPSAEIAVGAVLPEFELTNTDGEIVAASMLAQQPTVFIFIRGNWCPLCMGQVNEISSAADRFMAAGLRVAFIAPQSVGKTRALAKGRPDGVGFYADIGNAAGRRLKIHNPGGLPLGMEILGYRSETVLPTIIGVDAGGRIRWTHETDNYRVRPSPDVIIKAMTG